MFVQDLFIKYQVIIQLLDPVELQPLSLSHVPLFLCKYISVYVQKEAHHWCLITRQNCCTMVLEAVEHSIVHSCEETLFGNVSEKATLLQLLHHGI